MALESFKTMPKITELVAKKCKKLNLSTYYQINRVKFYGQLKKCVLFLAICAGD